MVASITDADGRELYFQSGSDVVAGGRPQRLFTVETPYAFQDVTPDGQRFLVLSDAEGGDAQPIHVMLGWKRFVGEATPR